MIVTEVVFFTIRSTRLYEMAGNERPADVKEIYDLIYDIGIT